VDFSYLKEFMDRLTSWRIPGNSIVVYHKNKEVFRYSSGFSDVENRIKMTGDELLNIYSCSKVATVTAALQLYEKGYFLLNDPLYEYIPEFKQMYIRDKEGNLEKANNTITLRNLFTMTAGFSYDMNSHGLNEARQKTKGKMPTLETVRYIAKDALLFEPGTRWAYSLGHDVLAGVVEVISGQRFSDYVKKNIFEPIGIKEIYYHRTDKVEEKMACQYIYRTKENVSDLVKAQISSVGEEGYWEKDSKAVTYVLGPEYDSGGAGIVVSAPDYAKFASCLANGGIAPNGEKIISKGTIDLLRTNQLSDNLLKDFNWSQLAGYGYGLGVRTMIDRAKGGTNGELGEFGWGGAAGATLLADPENEFAYFYAHHMKNPQEGYYQPRLRNVAYSCIK